MKYIQFGLQGESCQFGTSINEPCPVQALQNEETKEFFRPKGPHAKIKCYSDYTFTLEEIITLKQLIDEFIETSMIEIQSLDKIGKSA